MCFAKSFDPGGLNKVVSRLLEKDWVFCGVTNYPLGAGAAWALVYPKVEVLGIPRFCGAQGSGSAEEQLKNTILFPIYKSLSRAMLMAEV